MMKINFFLVAAFAVILFGSCSNDGNTTTPEDVYVNFKVKLESNSTKAVGNPNFKELDNKLQTLAIYFFRADGRMDIQPKFFTSAETDLTTVLPTMEVTTQLRSVYVIANLAALPTNIYTLAGLRAFEADMSAGATQTSASTQVYPSSASGTDANVYQYGSVAVSETDLLAGTASAAITLHFAPGRIQVAYTFDANNVWISNNTGSTNAASPNNATYDPTVAKPYIDLTEIAVLNAKQKTLFFPTSATSLWSSSSNYYSGFSLNSSWVNVPTGYAARDFYKMDIPKVGETTKGAFFYIFANNPTSFTANTHYPTIITLKGKYYPDGETQGSDIYFSVPFDGVKTVKIENGKAYLLTFNLKSDPRTGAGGITDPTNPPADAGFSSFIAPAVWVTVLNPEKVFN